jgi:hypothetical protein
MAQTDPFDTPQTIRYRQLLPHVQDTRPSVAVNEEGQVVGDDTASDEVVLLPDYFAEYWAAQDVTSDLVASIADIAQLSVEDVLFSAAEALPEDLQLLPLAQELGIASTQDKLEERMQEWKEQNQEEVEGQRYPGRLFVYLDDEGAVAEPRTVEEANTLSIVPLPDYFANYWREGVTAALLQDIAQATEATQEDVFLSYVYGILSAELEEPPEDIAFADLQQQVPEQVQSFANLAQELGLYSTPAEVHRNLRSWSDYIDKVAERDRTNISEFASNVDKLMAQTPLPRSEIVYTSGTIKARAKTADGQPLSFDDALDVFDNAEASLVVPFIFYYPKTMDIVTPQAQGFYKLYSSGAYDGAYNKILQQPGEEDPRGTFYFTVWTGDRSREPSAAPKASFKQGKLNIEDGTLTMNTPLNNRVLNKEELPIVLSRLEEATGLDFSDFEVTGLYGETTLFDIDFDQLLFLDMVLNDPVLRYFVFNWEPDRSAAERKTMNYGILEPLKISEEDLEPTFDANVPPSTEFVIVQEFMEAAKNPESFGHMLHIYLRSTAAEASTTQGGNKEELSKLDRVASMLPYLMAYAKSLQEQYRQEYAEVFSWYRGTASPEAGERKGRKSKPELENLRNLGLQKGLEGLFIDEYSRQCQRVRQPTIIQESEVEEWKNKTVFYKGKERERDIMAYPPQNPKALFVCNHELYPFPGVTPNDRPNKDKYPYVPCCFTTPQMDPDSQSPYNEWLGIQQRVPKGSQQEIKTNKVLQHGRVGKLPINVETFLRIATGRDSKFQRYGVDRSKNSFLSCLLVLYAEEVPDSKDERMSLAREFREAIPDSGAVSLAVLKQELYDRSEEEIAQEFGKDTFFDPSRFYRALEEYFNINIFVFSNIGDARGSLEIPRHKIFSAKTPDRDRPCVLLYKHLGSESDSLQYPQVELIVESTDSGEIRGDFEDLNDEIYELYRQTHKTLTWTRDEELYQNIYSRAGDIAKKYRRQGSDRTAEGVEDAQTESSRSRPASSTSGIDIRKQVIDGYGKTRALQISIQEGSDRTAEGVEDAQTESSRSHPASSTSSREITLVVPPSQPLNIPATSEILYPPASYVARVLPTPTTVTKNANGEVTGAWYRFATMQEGIYVPFAPTTQYFVDVPEGSTSGLAMIHDKQTTGQLQNTIARMNTLSRNLGVFLQVLEWLLHLYNSELVESGDISPVSSLNNKENVSPLLTEVIHAQTGEEEAVDTIEQRVGAFLEQYTFIPEEANDEDSLELYDLSSLPRMLPDVATVSEGVSWIASTAPQLVAQGRIMLYTEHFATSMEYFLGRYAKYSLPEQRISSRITARMGSEDDFKRISDNLVFFKASDMYKWIETTKEEKRRSKIVRTLDKQKLKGDSKNASSGQHRTEGRTMNPVQHRTEGRTMNPVQQPVLFVDTTDASTFHDTTPKYYIVQTVDEGDLSRALACAQSWKEDGNNPGYFAEPLDEYPGYVVYKISSVFTPVLEATKAQDPTSALSVLRYDNFYAAMLPLPNA